ncbi:hypothetical protein MRX96_007744 [Rhipicephalus microplus]
MMKCTTDDRFLNQIALASLWIFLTHYGHLVTEVVVDGWQSEERSLPKLLYQHCRNVECVQLINVPDDATFGPLTKVLLGFCSRNRILRFKCMRPEVDLNSMTPMPHPFPDINDRDEAAGKLLQYIIAHTESRCLILIPPPHLAATTTVSEKNPPPITTNKTKKRQQQQEERHVHPYNTRSKTRRQ